MVKKSLLTGRGARVVLVINIVQTQLKAEDPGLFIFDSENGMCNNSPQQHLNLKDGDLNHLATTAGSNDHRVTTQGLRQRGVLPREGV